MRIRKLAATAASVVLAVVLGSSALPMTASADINRDKVEADNQVAALKHALEETSAQLRDAYQRLQQTQTQVPAAQQRVAEAQALEAAATRRNDELAAQLKTAQQNEALAVQRIAANTKALAGMQTTLDSLAADVFQGGQPSQLAVALGASSPDDFAASVSLADTVTSLTNETLRNLQTARAEGAAQEAYLRAVRVEIAALKVEAEKALAAATVARADAQAAKAALDTLVAKQADYTKQVEVKRAAELARLRAAEQEQARLTAMLKERARLAKIRAEKLNGKPGGDSGGSTSRGGFLNYPANGPITSEFGMRFHPILGYWKLHTGTDFGIACGTPVYATANGTLISAGWNSAYGNRILIDHGIISGVNLVTTYNHLSSIVKYSGHVSRGQLIGYSGTTGWSTGCHLHFETLEDGSFVNPRNWI
jgi:murein DD-endopeptidase MepM/ murein hydrolase activator NlpD